MRRVPVGEHNAGLVSPWGLVGTIGGETDMPFLWLLAAIWLSAAALLPLHILFKAMFRVHRRQEPTQAMRVLRGY